MSCSLPLSCYRFCFAYLILLFCGASPALVAQQISPEVLHGLRWRLIGPHRGGRVTAVAGIPGNTKTYYMGTPGGGVWKTTNAGHTWLPIFDQAQVASIGDLVVAPSNPNTIYVATGEQTNGNGVWKSTDDGATWTNLGFGDSPIIPSILVDPHDANRVYVAVAGNFVPGQNRGIFRSADGGRTWSKVFYKDDHTSPTELDFDPDNSHIIVATIRRIPPAPGEKPTEGLDTELLRSTDAGNTWTVMGQQGLPSEHRQRVGLAIAPALGGTRIFALMAQGLFRSDDSGATWQRITTEYTLPDHAVPGETPRFQPPGPFVSPGTYDLVLTVQGKSYRQKLQVDPDPRVHISAADYAAQFHLSQKLSELMTGSARCFYALDSLEAQLVERAKSLPSTAPKDLSGALGNAERQLHALESGTDLAPGFGTINRDAGRYLEMVQAADIAPTESVRKLYEFSCEAYGKSVASQNKFANQTLPALNRQLEAEKLAAISFTPSAAAVPACMP